MNKYLLIIAINISLVFGASTLCRKCCEFDDTSVINTRVDNTSVDEMSEDELRSHIEELAERNGLDLTTTYSQLSCSQDHLYLPTIEQSEERAYPSMDGLFDSSDSEERVLRFVRSPACNDIVGILNN